MLNVNNNKITMKLRIILHHVYTILLLTEMDIANEWKSFKYIKMLVHQLSKLSGIEEDQVDEKVTEILHPVKKGNTGTSVVNLSKKKSWWNKMVNLLILFFFV